MDICEIHGKYARRVMSTIVSLEKCISYLYPRVYFNQSSDLRKSFAKPPLDIWLKRRKKMPKWNPFEILDCKQCWAYLDKEIEKYIRENYASSVKIYYLDALKGYIPGVFSVRHH